jgi:hypothetical protein
MTRRAPWHSERPGERVYHDHRECAEGKAIPPLFRGEGTAGRPLCKTCARLAASVGFAATGGWDIW